MMEKNTFEFDVNIPVLIFREDKKFVAYSHALDLSTSGDSYEEVKRRFDEIVEIFLEEVADKNTLKEVLEDLGRSIEEKKFIPPVIVSHEYQKVKLCL